jgi:tetratricopeptide (TPR) repeat protein
VARVADLVHEAKARESAGEGNAAERAWEEVLALRPRHASALYATARLRRARGDLLGSLGRIGECIAAEPRAGRARLLAVEILSDPGSGAVRDLARAEALAREALSLNPEESGPHLALGRVLLLRGDPPGACERLAVAAAMNPRDPESRSLLGVGHLRAGRREEARRSFEAALAVAAVRGVAAGSDGGVRGEGDTLRSRALPPAPAPGVLRAVAGLAALGIVAGPARRGEDPPAGLVEAAEAALAGSGGAEALLDADGDGRPDASAVGGPDGATGLASWSGGTLQVFPPR